MNPFRKYATFAVQAVREQGLFHCAADLASELAFDIRNGAITSWPSEPKASDARPESVADSVQYQGANPRLVGRLFECLPAEAVKAHFIDYGCGRGRALVLAAQFGFQRVTGIEFDAGLADASRRNLGKADLPANTRFEVLAMDATDYQLPPDPVVLFFFNPFGGGTLRRVALQIQRRLALNHSVWLVYLNPKWLSVFEEIGLKSASLVHRRQRLIGVVLVPDGNGAVQTPGGTEAR